MEIWSRKNISRAILVKVTFYFMTWALGIEGLCQNNYITHVYFIHYEVYVFFIRVFISSV